MTGARLLRVLRAVVAARERPESDLAGGRSAGSVDPLADGAETARGAKGTAGDDGHVAARERLPSGGELERLVKLLLQRSE